MSAQPRILVVTNSYPNRYKPYAGWYVKQHVAFHREAGLDTDVLTTGDSRRGGFRSLWKYATLSLKVVEVLLLADFDLVHAHWVFPAGLYGVILSKLRRKPFVLTSHGMAIHNFDSQPRILQRIAQYVWRSTSVIIVVGKKQGESLTGIAHLSNKPIREIGMGVYLDRPCLSKEEARRKLDLPSDEKILLFIGNLEPLKGVDVLLKAAAVLSEWGEEFLLFIGGQGPQLSNILKMIQDLGLENTTNLVGTIAPENVFDWLSAADVCVVPSRSETFGIVAVEAMACSTTVVASDVGGLSEKIEHGRNGLLFPSEDHQALAACLQKALNDDNLRESIARQGPPTALLYDMRSQASKVREVYEELLFEAENNVEG